MATIDAVLTFWFGTAPTTNADDFGARMKRWYAGSEAEYAAIRARFADTIEQALAGRLAVWRETPRGRLALILLLDQMTRSVFRGTARAFAGDARAQVLAVEALDAGVPAALDFERATSSTCRSSAPRPPRSSTASTRCSRGRSRASPSGPGRC